MRAQTALRTLVREPVVPGPVPRELTSGGWKEHGSCGQTDPELWFADTSRRILARAASICHDCPVRRPCLAWALVFDEQYGVWGGRTPAERRPLRRRLTRGDSLAVVIDRVFSSAGPASGSGSASGAGGEVA